jgi:hypothetical protein
MSDEKLQVRPNIPFKWRKGFRLQTESEVTIVLPGVLIKEGETIGSIIEVSADAQIGFQPVAAADKPVDYIIVKMKPGMFLKIHRNTEAMLLSDSEVHHLLRSQGISDDTR